MNIHNIFLDFQQDAEKDSREPPLFILEFFNIKAYFDSLGIEGLALSRVVNSLIKGVNEKHAKLPKYLVVLLDKDILYDIDQGQSMQSTQIIMGEITRWLVRQINVVLRRKRIDLLEKCPGTVSGYATKVIFVCML